MRPRSSCFDEQDGPRPLSFDEELWAEAIRDWLRGDDAAPGRLLVLGRPIPEFARHWLAGVIAGTVKRESGRPAGRSATPKAKMARVRASVLFEVLREEYKADRGGGGTPTERAIQAVTRAFPGMSEAQVRKIVFPGRARALQISIKRFDDSEK